MREYRKDEQGKSTRDFVFQGGEGDNKGARQKEWEKKKEDETSRWQSTIRKQTLKLKEKEGGHDVTWLVQVYKLSRGEKEGRDSGPGS